jgi:enhancer of mRNA-decapping protein 4
LFIAERLQRVLGERASQDKAKHDQLLTTLTRTLERTISAKLEKTVRDEIRNVVVPSIAGIVEPIKVQLHNELAQKLTATDALMKDSIGKMVRSKVGC